MGGPGIGYHLDNFLLSQAGATGAHEKNLARDIARRLAEPNQSWPTRYEVCIGVYIPKINLPHCRCFEKVPGLWKISMILCWGGLSVSVGSCFEMCFGKTCIFVQLGITCVTCAQVQLPFDEGTFHQVSFYLPHELVHKLMAPKGDWAPPENSKLQQYMAKLLTEVGLEEQQGDYIPLSLWGDAVPFTKGASLFQVHRYSIHMFKIWGLSV